MKPRRKPWTDEDDERLKKLAADGASPARAAAALNRTTQSVQMRAAKLGVRFPTLREQREKIGTHGAHDWEHPQRVGLTSTEVLLNRNMNGADI